MNFEYGVNLAMIGDEDVTCSIRLESYPCYRKIKSLKFYFEKFADTHTVIRHADNVLQNKPDIDLIMLFPLLWDIVYMKFDEFNYSTIHLKRDTMLESIESLIVSSHKRWQVSYPHVTIFWCLPFTPDFYRFNKNTDFWGDQEDGRTFYYNVRILGSQLYANAPGIHLLDLHECYFLKFSVCENSFYENISEPLRYVHSCTENGLSATLEFTTNFVSVFESKVYPIVLESKISHPHPSTSYDYNNKRLLNMQVFDYSSVTSGGGGTQENLNYESDYQNSKESYDTKSNEMSERSFSIQAKSIKSFDHQHKRGLQAYPPYQSEDSGSFHKWQTQSFREFNENNYCDNSNTPYGLPDGNNCSLPHDKKDHTSSRSLTEELSSYFEPENSNASSSSNKFQVNNNPQYNPSTSWEDQSSTLDRRLSHSPSNSVKCSEVKPNIGNDILKGLSSNVLSSIKDALSFLSTNTLEKENSKASSYNTDNETSKDSSYYEKYIKNFFSPLHWKDVFLSGDENIALDCLLAAVNNLTKIPYKKGMVIVMITTSEDLITHSLEALKPQVESNTIGLNDDITFGTPLVLVDTVSNIQLRLKYVKQQSLGDLSALLAFGDELLDLSSLACSEFTHLVKHLLSNSRGDCNKVVISQSGSADIEISAQSVFNVTFLSPKRRIDKEKEEEKFNQSVGLTDFLKSSSADLEVSKDSPLSSHSSSLPPVVEKQDEVMDTKVSKSAAQKKSKTPELKRERSNSRPRSPKKSSGSSHSTSSKSSPSTFSKPLKSTIKLEDIFKRARISIPEKKKKENDAYNKEFMKQLGKMPLSIQDAYIKEGKEVLKEHESNYKTYKSIPDLHPAYEEKYEFFIKLFEEAYGNSYLPKYLQSAWKRFWEITVSCIKDLEWLDVKKELQEKFMSKHKMNELKNKEIKVDKVENKSKKLKVGDKMCSGKSQKSDMKAAGREGNKIEEMEVEIIKEIKNDGEVKLEKENKIPKIDCKAENIKGVVKSESKDTKKEMEEKDDRKVKKRSSSPGPLDNISKKAKGNENERSKSKTPPSSSVNDNKPLEAALGEKSENQVKVFDSSDENLVKSPVSSLKTVIEMRRKLIIDANEDDKYPFAEIEGKKSDEPKKDLKNESKESISFKNQPSKTDLRNDDKEIILSRNQLSKTDIRNDDKEIILSRNQPAKTDLGNDSKENISKKQFVKMTSRENKPTSLKRTDKSKIEEKVFNEALKNTDSLMKEVDKLLAKGSQLSESKSLSSGERKSYKERSETLDSSQEINLKKKSSDNRRDEKRSSHYRLSKIESTPSSAQQRNKDQNNLFTIDTYQRKYNERDDFHTNRTADSDRKKASFERDDYYASRSDSIKRKPYEGYSTGIGSDSDRNKYLHGREEYRTNDKSHSRRTEKLPLKKESTSFQDKGGDISYKNLSLNLLSDKDVKTKLAHDQRPLSTLISPFTKQTPSTSIFSTGVSSSEKALFPIQIPQNKPLGRTLPENSEEEDFMKLYINTCSELSKQKSETVGRNTSSRPSISSVLEDLDSLVKPSSHKMSNPSKSKIVINLGKPKFQFSLYEALNALESICPDIGVMGAALNSIVESSRALLPNFYEAYKLFTDSDSELLVNIAVNKLKSFSSRSTEEKVKYQKTIALVEKLLEEAKKSTFKGPPPSTSNKPPIKSRINVEAVAKATVGLNTKDTYQFIKNTFVYKGLSEPSKGEMERVFEEVTKFHFKFALKN